MSKRDKAPTLADRLYQATFSDAFTQPTEPCRKLGLCDHRSDGPRGLVSVRSANEINGLAWKLGVARAAVPPVCRRIVETRPQRHTA